MVPKIHAKGSSFKGAAAYLLHDKDRADTDERVAWSEVRNLAVDDPDKAWRIMAATALDQDRLKAQAGVKNTGRKSDKHVLHISLAWHPDQSPSREDMIVAADQAIKAIGAQDRQALFVAHDDESHPHLHLLINRVSPENGKHLSSSNDRLKLSKWAENYERETGDILCENRVINNAMRAKGNYVKGARDIARHIFEKMPKAANDNDYAAGVIAAQRAKDHALAQTGRDQAKGHVQAWVACEARHEAMKTALARKLTADIAKAKAGVLEEFRPAWRDLNREQASERRTFDALEESFFGRASNIVRTVQLTAQDIGADRSRVITRSFRILTNAGERKVYFEAAQERAQKALEARQAEKVAQAAAPLKSQYSASETSARAAYLEERQALVKSQQDERAGLKDAWKARNLEREAVFTELEAKSAQRQALKADYDNASQPRSDERAARLARFDRMAAFARSAKGKTREQDNKRAKDGDPER